MGDNKYFGIYQGVVTNIADPEKRGRIKVLCPDLLGGTVESAWCEPVVTVAYDNGGDFCIPAKDETVWLQFIAGDINRPVYLGGWWQKEKTPLGTNYTGIDKLRIIKYADCTITMRNGMIDINTGSGAFDLQIKDGQVNIQGNLNVSGVVNAHSIHANGGSGVVTANAITANTSVVASSVSATSVSATSVTASGISLSDHKHGGVDSGSSDTSGPK